MQNTQCCTVGVIRFYYYFSFMICRQTTWCLQGFFPLSIRLSIDVTGDVVKGEKKVVLFMELSRKLNLHLGTQQKVMYEDMQGMLQFSMKTLFPISGSTSIIITIVPSNLPHHRSLGFGSDAGPWNRLLW